MKAKWSLLGMFSLMIFLFSSCQKDQSESNLNQGNTRLKQILLFPKIESKEPISIVEEYEYDEKGRISRTSSPMYQDGTIVGTIKYNIYEYNSSEQLVKIINFNANLNSPTGFINLKNYIYSYSADGKKVKESIENQNGILFEYSVYEYKDDQLVKIKKYSHNELESYIENQYDRSGKLIKESFYASDGNCISYTIHTYSGLLQVKSDLYIYQSDTHYRSIRRTYDNNNNLITLESNELSLYSSMMSFVFRYEYFEEI
ncbi:MAG: hypothetical protein WC854_11290 [Bacteroidales bacterium]